MERIDLSATIGGVTFAPEVWEWLNLLGDVFIMTQQEAMDHDDFLADTPHKQLLVRAIQRDISTILALYTLLRCELIHQAAAHVRLFCESLITLRYVSKDAIARVPLFLNYADIESYEMVRSVLAWERERANPAHLARVQALLQQLQQDYDRVKSRYFSTDRKGRQRPFRNWCDTNIAEQAKRCGKRIERLYEIVYSQLSAYVHGSAWSLRRQMSYSKKHYDSRVILNDIATIVRTALVVWEEWANLCEEQVEWTLTPQLIAITSRLDALDSKHFPVSP